MIYPKPHSIYFRGTIVLNLGIWDPDRTGTNLKAVNNAEKNPAQATAIIAVPQCRPQNNIVLIMGSPVRYP